MAGKGEGMGGVSEEDAIESEIEFAILNRS